MGRSIPGNKASIMIRTGASPPAPPDALTSPLVKKGAWQERALI